MKRTLFFFCFSLTCFAQLSDFAVKVQSGDCKDPNPYHGSGLLLSYQGKAFVLTSDHVVLHNYQSQTCHQIFNEQLGIHKASYDTAEWGNGLALMEVRDLLPTSDWPTLESLKPLEAKIKEQATVMGFPADSESLVVDTRGKISEIEVELPFFAMVPKLIEVQGAHGEFGMSGGVVLSGERYLGLLSHQRVMGSDNRLFVIPAAVVYEWLRKTLPEGVMHHTYFYQDADTQLLKLDSVTTAEAGIDFVVWEGFHHISKDPTVRIQRFLDPTNKEHFRDPFGRLERMYQFLLSPATHTHVQVHFFRQGALLSRSSTLVPVKNVADLFLNVMKLNSVPLFITPIDMVDWDNALVLRKKAQDCMKELESFSGIKNTLLSQLDAAAFWLSQIPDSIETLDERWTLVTTQDLEDIKTNYPKDWGTLEKYHPTESQRIRSLMEAILQDRKALLGF